MLYSLLSPLGSDFILFNVFRYITFRSVWALITALVISIVFGPRFIAWLQRINCRQPIHEDVKAHQVKAGTPTMGGLLIAFSLCTSVFLWGNLENRYIWLALFVFLGFSAVGFWDDYSKIHHHQNRGLSARAKFWTLTLVSGIVVLILLSDPGYSTRLSFPFFKSINPDLGWFYVPFAMFVMVGSSNAVNLTDGLDGLAIGPMVVAGLVFSVFIYASGHVHFANYLQLEHIPGIGEVAVFCSALVGAGLGFLWFNAFPAQVFMGDVGSLGLGGVLGFLAVLCKQEMMLVIVGGLFVVETLSVILQVSYFRWTGGKRILRMAPLHHHFEMMGIPESKIIIRFWIVSALLGLMALSVLKLR
ncbi:MAG: phospho-N-acetylmuramoyl-pentapeptide-transferase [Desulfovibrionaceae bacterium]|nr:phospho-N-acetylmuramoyl-pentapeptide-transferase [Desulfovibrionaceae bacterium]